LTLDDSLKILSLGNGKPERLGLPLNREGLKSILVQGLSGGTT
jgi:hypothetical protein